MTGNAKHTMDSHTRLSGPRTACLCTDYKHSFPHPYGIIVVSMTNRALDVPYLPDFEERDYPTMHGE